MEGRELNRVMMLTAVVDFYNEQANKTAIQTLPKLNEKFQKVEQDTDKIFDLIEEQTEDLSYITDEKSAQRTVLNDILLLVCKLAMFYANDKNNYEVAAKCKLSKSAIAGLRGAEVYSQAKAIYLLLSPIMVQILPYGLTQQNILDLYKAYGDFKKLMPKPKKAIGARAKVTKLSKSFVNDTIKILDELVDNGITAFQKTNPQMCDNYSKAREIIEEGVRHNGGIIFIIKDSLHNKPISDVKLTVPNTTGETIKHTNTKGVKAFSLGNGDYEFTAEKEGFTTQGGTFVIKDGEVLTMSLRLVKS